MNRFDELVEVKKQVAEVVPIGLTSKVRGCGNRPPSTLDQFENTRGRKKYDNRFPTRFRSNDR